MLKFKALGYIINKMYGSDSFKAKGCGNIYFNILDSK